MRITRGLPTMCFNIQYLSSSTPYKHHSVIHRFVSNMTSRKAEVTLISTSAVMEACVIGIYRGNVFIVSLIVLVNYRDRQIITTAFKVNNCRGVLTQLACK